MIPSAELVKATADYAGPATSEVIEDLARRFGVSTAAMELRKTALSSGCRFSNSCPRVSLDSHLDCRSPAEFAVRADAHQIEVFGVWLAVDQHQVGADMAVPVVLPLPAQRVVAVARRERPVFCQLGHNARKLGIDGPGEAASSFAPVIPFEDRGPPNRPHGGRPSGRRRRRP